MNYVVQQIRVALKSIVPKKQVIFGWLPGHVNIPHNERADREAKLAVEIGEPVQLGCAVPDVNNALTRHTMQLWQNEWQSFTELISSIKPQIQDWREDYEIPRRDQVIVARLRMNKCRFSVQHFVTGEDEKACDGCSERLTITHIFIYCPYNEKFRKPLKDKCLELNIPYTLASILAPPMPMDLVIAYLKDTNCYEII